MNRKLISTNMRILIFILLILSIIFYTSGCVVLAKSGYKLSDYADQLNFTTHNINSYFNNKMINFNLNESAISNEQPISENIHSIEFNLTAENIQLKNYSGDVVKVQIKSNLLHTPSELPAIESDNKLIFNTIPNNPSNASVSISIPYSFNDKGDIKVTTSSGYINISNLSPKGLTLSTASGHIDLSNSNYNYLSINTSSSDINLNNITTLEETKLSSNSGSIKFNGNPGILSCANTSGDINLHIKDTLNNTSLSTLSGHISLSLPKNSGYKINYETLSGEFNSPNNDLSNGDESSIINLRTVSGDINIH